MSKLIAALLLVLLAELLVLGALHVPGSPFQLDGPSYITMTEHLDFTRDEYAARVEGQIERLGELEVCIGAAAVVHRYTRTGFTMTPNDTHIWAVMQEVCTPYLEDSPGRAR